MPPSSSRSTRSRIRATRTARARSRRCSTAWGRSRRPSSTTRAGSSSSFTSGSTATRLRSGETSPGTRVPDLRIDPLTGLRTIVAGERAGRPGGDLQAPPRAPLDLEKDPFLEGHEQRTPAELFALRPGGGSADGPGWTARVVPNLYPALSPTDPPDTGA